MVLIVSCAAPHVQDFCKRPSAFDSTIIREIVAAIDITIAKTSQAPHYYTRPLHRLLNSENKRAYGGIVGSGFSRVEHAPSSTERPALILWGDMEEE